MPTTTSRYLWPWLLIIANSFYLAQVHGHFDLFNRGRRFCESGDQHNIMHANCDEFDGYAMRHCLRQFRLDPIISELVRRCPSKLPSNHGPLRRFDKYAERLIQMDMPRTFRAFLGDGRCAKLTDQGRQRVRLAMDRSSNPPIYLQIYQQACGPLGLGFRTTGMAGPGVPVAPLAAPSPPGGIGPGPMSVGGVNVFSGRVASPLLPPTAMNSPTSWTGPVEFINEIQVRQDFTILTRISPNQACRFGLLNTACRGLTEAHFRQPGVSADTVANLPLQCFRQIPPPAFAGLTPLMIAKIPNWPYASPQQIRFVRTGDPVRAIPFDQLGLGRQFSRRDKFHPCYGITREQRRSINRSFRARREYHRRCVHSAASPALKGSWKPIIVGILFGMVLTFA